MASELQTLADYLIINPRVFFDGDIGTYAPGGELRSQNPADPPPTPPKVTYLKK